MKRLLALLFILCFTVQAADTQSRAIFVVTGVPIDGDTITYRGVTRTWKNTITTAGTQIQIGASAIISANNLVAQIATYPFDANTATIQQGVTNVTFLCDANLSVTASLTGTWGTVAVTTTPLTQRGISFPFATEPTATRTNDANDLILAFNYANTAFGGAVAALSNYVSTLGNKTVTGPLNLFGANVLSNANQIIALGYLTNITRADVATENVGTWTLNTQGYIIGGLKVTNETPQIEFWQSDGSADHRRSLFRIDQSGLNVSFTTDNGASLSNVFTIDRTASGYGASDAIFRTRLTADYIYNTTLSNVLTTNGVFLHTAAASIGSLMGTGNFAISNTAPILTLHDTDAASGSQKFVVKANANQFEIAFADDSGTIPLSPSGDIFKVSRTHGTDATGETMNIYPIVNFNAAVNFLTGDIVGNALARLGNGVIIGSGAGTNLPTGASQALLLAPGAGPSGTLSGSSILWSSGGELFFRNGLASEGDTADSRVYNRTATVSGAGTDYSLTGSTAFVDFGTTDPKITLPTAGTYLIWADVALTGGASANDDYRFKLRNETASADLSGSDQEVTYLGASQLTQVKLQATVAGAASDVIAIWGFNNTAARGTVNSARTRIGYVRLY